MYTCTGELYHVHATIIDGYIHFYIATTTTVVIMSSSENGHPMSSNVIQPTIVDGPQTTEANTMTSKLAEQTEPILTTLTECLTVLLEYTR